LQSPLPSALNWLCAQSPARSDQLWRSRPRSTGSAAGPPSSVGAIERERSSHLHASSPAHETRARGSLATRGDRSRSIAPPSPMHRGSAGSSRHGAVTNRWRAEASNPSLHSGVAARSHAVRGRAPSQARRDRDEGSRRRLHRGHTATSATEGKWTRAIPARSERPARRCPCAGLEACKREDRSRPLPRPSRGGLTTWRGPTAEPGLGRAVH
jgi:hypothetical protein